MTVRRRSEKAGLTAGDLPPDWRFLCVEPVVGGSRSGSTITQHVMAVDVFRHPAWRYQSSKLIGGSFLRSMLLLCSSVSVVFQLESAQKLAVSLNRCMTDLLSRSLFPDPELCSFLFFPWSRCSHPCDSDRNICLLAHGWLRPSSGWSVFRQPSRLEKSRRRWRR